MNRTSQNEELRLQLEGWDPAAREELSEPDRVQLRAALLVAASAVERGDAFGQPRFSPRLLALAAVVLLGAGLAAVPTAWRRVPMVWRSLVPQTAGTVSPIAKMQVVDSRAEGRRWRGAPGQGLLDLPVSAPVAPGTKPPADASGAAAARRQRRVQLQGRAGTRIYWTLDSRFEEIPASSVGF